MTNSSGIVIVPGGYSLYLQQRAAYGHRKVGHQRAVCSSTYVSDPKSVTPTASCE
ncbi:exodeoxyribonuclease VII large subunit [Anopheles sinensis]|uniref:Exodeoxyribonuclease VII large subunit n=1 Tax=Anopheles sinensis TaxID=74873 RepID=A0A084VTS2_ANOSI|nr:exodeoxyribonuclease VII large subunit [Anopheles sinensis]